jgi:hypothetical protein
VFVDATASDALAIETVARCRLEGNMMRIAWLLAGALLVPTQALPRTKTGNELLYDCTHESAINQAMCLGFIDGIAENPHKDFGVFCIPEEVPLAQLWVIVVDHLKRNVRDLQYPATVSVLAALQEAFPCPK